MNTPRRIDIAPGIWATVTPAEPLPMGDVEALRATARELVALLDATEAAEGSKAKLRSAQGLARSLAARAEGLR